MFLAHYGPAEGGRSPENQPAPVIPAKLVPAEAGSGNPSLSGLTWTPAYAGVTTGMIFISYRGTTLED
jgi:hypothetical protein